eukprot:TRINITY_DN10759_c0_g1_i3.p1 TRINITY_DN10759_c0_g1~~TRINITY_DN10759_c0_g1_i3.p1  ORF type:complete len:489 (-),score=99.93 TRINITY_DN10759_c0_g1_i3:180-1646(-)
MGGDRLTSGCEVLSGNCIVRVDTVLERSMLFEVSSQMREAMGRKFEFQNIIDTISRLFVPCIILLAIATDLAWFFGLRSLPPDNRYLRDGQTPSTFAFERALSVLVISCPCALGLAVPTVVTVALNKAVKAGILVKTAAALEKTKRVNAFVFDKTGTLLQSFARLAVIEFPNQPELWRLVARAEAGINHPIAEILHKEALKKLGGEGEVAGEEEFSREVLSKGVKATIGGREITIGNKSLFPDLGEWSDRAERLESQGMTVVLVSIDRQVTGYFAIDNSASLRPESKRVIKRLLKDRHDVYILSGDNKDAVEKIGKSLGVKEGNLVWEADPQAKRRFLVKMKEEEGKRTMMVGDGLNDLMSLAEAYIGVTINAKSELNLMASDAIILKEDLTNLLDFVKLSKYTMRFIYLNLTWAFIYNVIAIPFAAGVFDIFFGISIPPMLSSLAMSASSLLILATSAIFRMISIRDFIPNDRASVSTVDNIKVVST